MKTYIFQAVKITLLTVLLFGIIYPLFIVGIATIIGPGAGDGETIQVDGKTMGFVLIGQSFTSEKYFNSRPSAVKYNAAATGGSNKGPSNPDYLSQVEGRIQDILSKNPTLKVNDIPVDLITASGEGLDPHISPASARIQIQRIAAARSLNKQILNHLVDQFTERPLLGLFGTSKVNVLMLNVALDKAK